MTVSELERSICLDWARVGAGQGNSVEDKRVRLESEDFDARLLRRGVPAGGPGRRHLACACSAVLAGRQLIDSSLVVQLVPGGSGCALVVARFVCASACCVS
jgi:hypothetical protein